MPASAFPARALVLLVLLLCLAVFAAENENIGRNIAPNNISRNAAPNKSLKLLQEVADPLSSPRDIKPCWVFNHAVKAGGSTVKRLLQEWIEKRRDMNKAEYATGAWKKGSAFVPQAFKNRNYRFIVGGFVESLRLYGVGEGCKWFTIFRDPVARLVSAFFYCKYKARRDPICASRSINLDDADIGAFAKHWSNYGLRQYALAYVSADQILSSPVAQACDQCPGWYLSKLYFDSLNESTKDGVKPEKKGVVAMDAADAGVVTFLEPALQVIESKYAAVGILENMNTTILLFDSVLGIPGFQWAHMQGTVANKNRKMEAEHNDVLRQASTDSAIKKYLWFDLIMYEHARSVHEEQLRQNDLLA